MSSLVEQGMLLWRLTLETHLAAEYVEMLRGLVDGWRAMRWIVDYWMVQVGPQKGGTRLTVPTTGYHRRLWLIAGSAVDSAGGAAAGFADCESSARGGSTVQKG
jgi:hypothetical protein